MSEPVNDLAPAVASLIVLGFVRWLYMGYGPDVAALYLLWTISCNVARIRMQITEARRE